MGGIVRGSLLTALCLAWPLAAAAGDDLSALDLQALMDVKVYAASKYEQGQAEAPAAVSIITAEDIRTYGWRTLGDMLRAQRGMYLSYDRIYGYLGTRGILVSGDLNSRLIVTVDGYRTNDVVYQQGFILNDFILDNEMIERVEVIRGPGSSLHGATPLFGVINIVTRDPRRSPNHELSAEAGGNGWLKGRYTFTKLLENNASLMLSASWDHADGADLYFESPPRFAGMSRRSDYETTHRLFAKYESGDLKAMFAQSSRDKGIPSGATGAVIDNPANHYIDAQTAFNLAYTWRLAGAMELEGRLYAGAYDFNGTLLYGDVVPPAVVANKDLAWGRWQGTEWKLTRRGPEHTWVAGVEYQVNSRQDQQNYYLGALCPPANLPYCLDDRRRSDHLGVYAQDEWRYSPAAALTLGARIDHDYLNADHLSPRLAWIYTPAADKTLKLIASRAFRAPNVAEAFYNFGNRFGANPELKAEHVTNYEAVFEHRLAPRTRYTVDPYVLKLSDRISQVTPAGALQYVNAGSATVRGVEFEVEHHFGEGRLRASYSRQHGYNETGQHLTDSPDDIATLNYSRELLGERLRLGAEYQYVGSRLTYTGGRTDPARLFNLNFTGQLWKRGPEWSVGLYNAFNYKYGTPDTPDPVLSRDRIEQDGRAWRAKLTLPY